MFRKNNILFILIILLTFSCNHKGILYKKKEKERLVLEGLEIKKTKENELLTNSKLKVDSIKTRVHVPEKSIRDYYESAYSEIQEMLEGKKVLDFKRAVFVSENAYFSDSLNYANFNDLISLMKVMSESIYKQIKLKDYHYPDSIKLKKNYAIFKVLKDTIHLDSNINLLEPIQYDFDDYLGLKKWSNTFVSKLLYTGVGNCHSMPYLYKIIANELQTEAYLTLAPNHIYIKHRSKRLGWYNTELTSGEFPSDAWVKASGYITIDAIRSGIYMDTLSQMQSVALCLYDLAKSYFEKTKNYKDEFVIKCCDLTLKYHSNNINAIILKAETLKKIYDDLSKNKTNLQEEKVVFDEMQNLYFSGLRLGYREMPIEMYQAWLNSLKTEQNKFVNKEINSTFKKN